MRWVVVFWWLCACAPLAMNRPAPLDRARGVLLRAGAGATFEDADVRAELAVGAQHAVVLTLRNKTEAPLLIDWRQLSLVANHVESPLSAVGQAELLPGGETRVVLPVVLAPSKRPVEARLELILPTVVRGTPREYHYLVRAPVDRHWRL